MRSTAAFITIIALIGLTLVSVISILNVREFSLSIVQVRIGLVWECAGLVVAVLSAGALLIAAVSGLSLDRLIALTLPLLGGVLLAHRDWSLAAAIGVIATAGMFRECFSRHRSGPPSN